MNLKVLILSRTTCIWLVLVAATVGTWQLRFGLEFAETRYAGAAVLVVAFIKVRLVMLEFMELRAAPVAMRLAAEIWAVSACALLVAMFVGGVFAKQLGGN